MVYQLKNNSILVEIDRTSIMDITPGDVVEPDTLQGAQHTWTEQDSQFVESNPDARLFIQFIKSGSGFKGEGILPVPVNT